MADDTKTPQEEKTADKGKPEVAKPEPSKPGVLPTSSDDVKALVAERDALKRENIELKGKVSSLYAALDEFKQAKKQPRKQTDSRFALVHIRCGRDVLPGDPLTKEEADGLTEGTHFEFGTLTA
jgi:hypothetical protein